MCCMEIIWGITWGHIGYTRDYLGFCEGDIGFDWGYIGLYLAMALGSIRDIKEYIGPCKV